MPYCEAVVEVKDIKKQDNKTLNISNSPRLYVMSCLSGNDVPKAKIFIRKSNIGFEVQVHLHCVSYVISNQHSLFLVLRATRFQKGRFTVFHSCPPPPLPIPSKWPKGRTIEPEGCFRVHLTIREFGGSNARRESMPT